MTSLSKYANCAQQQFPLQSHKTLDRILCIPKGKRVCMDCIGRFKAWLALAGRVIKFKVRCFPPANSFPASYFLYFEAQHYCLYSPQ